MKKPKLIQIPRRYWNWPLSQVPVTTRLRTVLRRRGCRRLGALHGVSWKELALFRGCGVRTVRDVEHLLTQLKAGTFEKQISSRPAAAPQRVVRIIENYCAQMKPRERMIFLARLGAKRKPVTLAAIGDRWGLTRERVRQIEEAHVHDLSRLGGPPFMLSVRRIISRSLARGAGTAEERLAGWLRSFRLRTRYSIEFHARVICRMRRFLRA